jgi:predicted dienelactone hydrolase
MRPLEIIIVLLNLVVLVGLYISLPGPRRAFRYLPAALVIVTLIHLIVEHYRWQMVPSYAMTVVSFLLSLPNLIKGTEQNPARSAWAFVAGGFTFLFWLIAVTLPIILPVPRMPPLPGPYSVGSVLYDWTDVTRPETYSSEPNTKREVMVQIWYPARPTADGQTMPLLDNFDVAIPGFAHTLKLPSFMLEHLRLVTTHTYSGAPIRDDRAPYPVVIVSHGYTGYRNEAFHQMEVLASSGYVVVAIDHPYASAFTVFADGRVALNYAEVLPPAGRTEPGDQELREKLDAVVSADQRFVLDQLELLNAGQLDARFTGTLDLQHIGVMGLSLGGGVTAWTCKVDARCKAGLAMDGWYEPLPQDILAEPLRVPFMFMQSETQMWKMDNLARLDGLYRNVNAPAYHLKFAGVLHQDFSDYPLLTPLSAPLMIERGTLDGKRTVAVIDAYMLAFFDRYLKNQPSSLLNGPSSDYPEVQFESHSP